MNRLALGGLAAAAIAVAACIVFAAGGDTPAAPPQPKAVSPAPAGSAEAPTAVATDLKPLAKPAASEPALKLPDGSTLPLLNGVKEPMELQWNSPTPYAKVIGSVYDPQTQTEWYVHEDGTHSTTIVRRDTVRNIDVGMCLVGHRRAATTKAELRSQ